MKLQLLVLLLGVAAVHSQSTAECEDDWLRFENDCYKFYTYPRYRLLDASARCQVDGASLISINSIQEHAFVMDWLNKFDSNRYVWLTSGVVSKSPVSVNWLGDGTSSIDVNYWLKGSTGDKQDGDVVAYSFSSTQYGWSVAEPAKNSSFICEIPVEDSYKIVEEKRDFDYGLEIDNPSLAPRGPRFVEEPEDTTILTDTSAVFMPCMAEGIPKPSYSWYRGESTTNMAFLPTGPDADDPRFSVIGGRLTIDEPTDQDEGIYQCHASNEFGTIVSRPGLLSFGTLGDFSNVKTSDVEGFVSAGIALVCPDITAKPAKVYQWHKVVDNKMIFIRPEFQTHTFISNSGILYFSELAPSDAGEYYCTVSLRRVEGSGNYIGSSQSDFKVSRGFGLTVKKGVSSYYNPVIQDDFIKVYPGNPKRGQSIQMECFAYGTAPLVYRWYRYNAEMPRKVVVTDAGRMLNIPNVQIEDGGQYGCRVDGSRTNEHDVKNYTLDVKSAPYFSYPLTNQHVDVGSRLSWHCEARGKPSPTYEWYKDGERFYNSTGVTVIGNTVVIDRLEKQRDNGMYQCAAMNVYGVSFSSAQIRVLEFKPTFRKHPVDSSLSAAVGGNITIICSPEAAPAPTYEWLFNGNNLGLVQGGQASNNFKMLMNGNLLIENVNNNHEGTYTCKATNLLGEDSSSGVLKVFPAIVISQRPNNVNSHINESASMLCKASAPPNVDVVYVWKFNGHIIDFEDEVQYRLGTGPNIGNLFIVGVQYKFEGFYTCLVTTGMDAAEDTAYLRVLGPPGEPSGVITGDNVGLDHNDVGLDERFVRLYWSDGLTHGSPIVAYIVEFRTNFNMTWRVQPFGNRLPAQDVQSAEYATKRTVLLRELKPYAMHQFRVRAINEFGVGEPSLPTDYIQVPGAVPQRPPSQLGGGGGKVGDLVITWKNLPIEDQNGPDLRYKLYWRPKPTTELDDSRWEDAEVTPEQVCRDNIPNVLLGSISQCSFTTLVGQEVYYKPYEVRIRAINFYGDGALSGIVTVMSAEEMPRATPRQVYSTSYNATALTVFWTPVANTRAELRGRLLGYRINYWARDEETEEQARFNIINLPAGADNVDHGRIIGLVPGLWYVVNVQAITSAGYGPKSEDYPQETANFAPAAYPTEVHVYSIEGVGVRVNFRGISTRVAEEPLMGYMLEYWPSGENIRKARNVDVGRDNFGTITNLTESILYELRVFGYSRGGWGEKSSPSVYFTVGDGQIQSNPETTEVMAGGSLLQSSLLTLLLCLVLSVVATRTGLHTHAFTS